MKRILRLIGFALFAGCLYYLVTTRGLLFGDLWKTLEFSQPLIEPFITMPAWIVLGLVSLPFLYMGLKK